VEALVDGVGDFPGVTKDRSIFTFSTGFDVGGGRIGGHGDRITGV